MCNRTHRRTHRRDAHAERPATRTNNPPTSQRTALFHHVRNLDAVRHLLLLVLGRCDVVLVLLHDHKALEDRRHGLVFFRGELGALSVREQDGRRMRLEASDGLGAASLPDDVHRLSHAHSHGDRLHRLVKCDEHPGMHGGREVVEQVVRLAENGALHVRARDEDREEARDRDVRHDAPVGVVGVDGHGALAHMKKALGDANHEEVVRVLVVERGKLTKHRRNARVVRACTNDAEGEDRVVRHLGVGVVGELAERVEHSQLGVRGAQHCECERDIASDHGLAVLEQVVERAEGHFRANVLAHGHEGNAEHRKRLVRVVLVFLLVKVVRGLLEHPLHLEHVARPRVRARVDDEPGEPAEGRVHGLEGGERHLRSLLLAEIEEAETEREEACVRLLEHRLRTLHHRLENGARDFRVARADRDQAKGQRRHAHELHRRIRVAQHRQDQLNDVLSRRSAVGKAQTNDGASAQDIALVRDVVAEKGERGVAVVPNARVHKAARKESARLDVILGEVEEAVDLAQAAVHVPQENHTERRSRAHHAVVLVLVQPLVALLRHELIVTETGVDERVHKRRRKVLLGRVARAAKRVPRRLQMALVNVLGDLRFDDVELARECHKLSAEMRVGHPLVERLALRLNVQLLPAEHERKLVLHRPVCARIKDLLDKVAVVELRGDLQCLRVAVELAKDGERRAQQLRVLGALHIVDATCEIEAHARVRLLIDVLLEEVKALDLREKVARLSLRVVLHVERNDLRHETKKIVDALFCLLPLLVQPADLARQMLDVLVTPRTKGVTRAHEAVIEALALAILLRRHGDNRQHIGQKALVLCQVHLAMQLLERGIVRSEKLERLRHRSHRARRRADVVAQSLEGGAVQGRVGILQPPCTLR
eukprot:Opistho-1_new@33196